MLRQRENLLAVLGVVGEVEVAGGRSQDRLHHGLGSDEVVGGDTHCGQDDVDGVGFRGEESGSSEGRSAGVLEAGGFAGLGDRRRYESHGGLRVGEVRAVEVAMDGEARGEEGQKCEKEESNHRKELLAVEWRNWGVKMESK